MYSIYLFIYLLLYYINYIIISFLSEYGKLQSTVHRLSVLSHLKVIRVSVLASYNLNDLLVT